MIFRSNEKQTGNKGPLTFPRAHVIPVGARSCVFYRWLVAELQADREFIYHPCYAGGEPCNSLSFPAFRPGTNGAAQYHLVAPVCNYSDIVRFNFRIPLERFFDLALDLEWARPSASD